MKASSGTARLPPTLLPGREHPPPPPSFSVLPLRDEGLWRRRQQLPSALVHHKHERLRKQSTIKVMNRYWSITNTSACGGAV